MHLRLENSPLTYLYDGSLAGLYCCVYESVYKKEMPLSIVVVNGGLMPTLFEQKTIHTDEKHAVRVRNSIREKISPIALELVEHTFLTCLREKEIKILRFLILGYQEGRRVTDMLGHSDVSPLLKANKHLWGEQHLLLGFVRFTDYGGLLVAVITPKNFVLPLMVDHFTDRYSTEKFLIYDKSHSAALVFDGVRAEIVQMENLALKPPDEAEEKYRALWKQFYKTIAIKERTNPVCRRSHMPMRYWENMLEVKDELRLKGKEIEETALLDGGGISLRRDVLQ
ncbi:TIGR03915 family putative DNA repair protein [Christensenellaceae bacterium OttesenSCG-928-M15]|nr:TIGR03915 family putative DNA repair protein [Christensenellaceae bacterium OttesenSCG-928-M15]